jgi:hypothetical protein
MYSPLISQSRLLLFNRDILLWCRVLLICALEQMVMKDGSIKTFEVSMEQFNQLRYSVAKVRLYIDSIPLPCS